MKKITTIFVVLSSSYLSAITSTMTHRVISTEPLLYSMIDYSKQQFSIEAAPFFLSMYDKQHTNNNLMINGQSTITLDQQGNGDINPTWLNLISNNSLANYNSTITLNPRLSQGGILLHLYKEYKKFYFDVRTAVLECSTQIKIEETGGQNGATPGISNALQAFKQPAWNYGKIGDSNQVAGLDDIQMKLGRTCQLTSNSFDIFMTGFGLVQAPTGTGTKSEWLFEPQVGTNHWGLGGGFEVMMDSSFELKFLIGGDYRYFMPAWEVRSFDLMNNGQWSRYLALQDTYGLPTAPTTSGHPGINYFTQGAKIEGRSQINLYTRLEKQFKYCAFELSYNFFYNQQETIRNIKNIDTGYGIYALTSPAGGSGGVTTAHAATINQSITSLDSTPVVLTTAVFDKTSAQAQSFTSNSLTARIQRNQDTYNYGIGANIEIAQSAGALSSWAIWAKFEYLFANSANESAHTTNYPTTLESFELLNDTQNTPTIQTHEKEFIAPSVNLNENMLVDTLQDDNVHNEFDNRKDNLIVDNSDKNNEYDTMLNEENETSSSHQDAVDIIIADGEIYDDFIIENDLEEQLQQDDEDVDNNEYNDNEILLLERLTKESIQNLAENNKLTSEENVTDTITSHHPLHSITEEPVMTAIGNNDPLDFDQADYYDENDLLMLEEFLMKSMMQDNDINNKNDLFEPHKIAAPQKITDANDLIVNVDTTAIAPIESLQGYRMSETGCTIPTEN